MTIASNDTDEPTTVREALSSSDSEHWHQAMQNEMKSFTNIMYGNLLICLRGRKLLEANGFSKLNIKLMDQLKGTGRDLLLKVSPRNTV